MFRTLTNESYRPDGTLISREISEVEVTELTRLEVYDLLTESQRQRIRQHAPQLFERLALAPEPISVATVTSYLAPLVPAGLLTANELHDILHQELL